MCNGNIMIDKIEQYISEIEKATAKSKDELEQFRLKFISRKGVMAELFDSFKLADNSSQS